jgi:glycosyltransferase involved in cell wall biosynthesis
LSELNKKGIQTFVCARNYYNLPRREKINGTHFHRSPVIGSSMAINSILYLIDSLLWLVWNRKKYGVIHCQQMFGPAMVAAIVSFIINKPILVRVTAGGELGEVKDVRQMPFANLRFKLLKRITKWVALTKEMKCEIETLNIPPEKIEIIYNATDIPKESAFDEEIKSNFRAKLGLDYEKIVVFVGRLSEEKGLDILVRAWQIVRKKYPQANLLLLGEGGAYRNVEKEIRELVSELKLNEAVHFLGHIANAKDYILASDIFVLPSRSEGMSNALVEAMAAGIAIVATDIAANQEICTNEVNSLLVRPNEPQVLAEIIIKLFDMPNIAENLARQAKTFAKENLSTEVMTSKYVNLYREMLNGN